MNSMKNAAKYAAIRVLISIGLANRESDCLVLTHVAAQRKTSQQFRLAARLAAICTLLFSPCVPAQAGLLKPDVNFSNYDLPLIDQLVNRIRTKVAARLGKGNNTHDRYFIVPFAYQNK